MAGWVCIFGHPDCKDWHGHAIRAAFDQLPDISPLRRLDIYTRQAKQDGRSTAEWARTRLATLSGRMGLPARPQEIVARLPGEYRATRGA